MQKIQIIFVALFFASAICGQNKAVEIDRNYEIALAKFAPMNTYIFTADADGSNAKSLLPNAESDYNASFSPDGKWIYFTSERNGSADIYRVHADGEKLERLTDDIAFDDQAAVSPDGKSLAFVSSPSGQADVWILDLKNKKLRNLTNNLAGDFRPAWSPDGQRIAFTRLSDGDYNIYTIKPDGGDVKKLTNTPGNDAHCAWSPDGKWIAFAGAHGGFKDESVLHPLNPQPYGEIFVMRAKGSDVRMLTDDQFEAATPSWIPFRRKKN